MIVAPDKVQIKKEMLSQHQLKITDLYIIPIQPITMVKTICQIQHTKKNRSGKDWRQTWKSIVQIIIMNNK